jgi:hypothetical protein
MTTASKNQNKKSDMPFFTNVMSHEAVFVEFLKINGLKRRRPNKETRRSARLWAVGKARELSNLEHL